MKFMAIGDGEQIAPITDCFVFEVPDDMTEREIVHNGPGFLLYAGEKVDGCRIVGKFDGSGEYYKLGGAEPL